MLLCCKEGKSNSGGKNRKEGQSEERKEGKQIGEKLSRLACPFASAYAYCGQRERHFPRQVWLFPTSEPTVGSSDRW